MLNPTRGGSHTSVKMTMGREYYQRIDVFKSPKEDGSASKRSLEDHGLFEARGKLDFGGLDLREYGWKREYALTPQQKRALENDPNYIDSEETMVYKGPQGIAVMHINYATDIHHLDIIIKNHDKKDSRTMDAIKFMFERELECQLKERRLEEILASNVKENIKKN